MDASTPRKPGRSPTGEAGFTVGVRLAPSLLAQLDAWAEVQPGPRPSRAEAVRSHVVAGLRARSAVSGGRGSELDDLRAQNAALVILADSLRQRLMRQNRPAPPERRKPSGGRA